MNFHLHDIAEEYLRSFPSDPKDPQPGPADSRGVASTPQQATRAWVKQMAQGAFAAGNLSMDKREQASLLFSQVLPHSEKIKNTLTRNGDPVMEQYAWQDLSLLAGNQSSPDKHMLGRISRTHTTAGDIAMAIQLVTPHTDVKSVQASQATIKAFLADKELTHSLNEHMQAIQAGERERLSFYRKDAPITNPIYKSLLGSFYFFNLFSSLHKSPLVLQLWKYIYDLGWGGRTILCCLAVLLRGLTLGLGAVPLILISCLSIGISVYVFYVAYQKKANVLNLLASYLLPFQQLVVRARQISDLVREHPELEKHLGAHLHYTRTLLQEADNGTSRGNFIYHLQKSTLQGRWYYFSYTGRMLATYTLLLEHHKQLADLTYEMGQIDMYLSLARLMEESASYSPENRFIFGQFDTAHSLPVLKAERMWHFGLDARTVVSNDLKMDATHGTRTLIITGPNAGGKSTYILGVASNVVLNQAFGIAAAEHFVQTIFGNILTYVNVTQNLAMGLSLAEAGMEVLRRHKAALEKADKPVLAIVDEILNGVDPQVAEDLSYKVLLGRHKAYPHCLTLLTTHFKGLTRLEKEDSHISNSKVTVRIPGDNGKPFAWTYKIEPGISDQNIVAEMLEEKGVL